MADTTGKLSQWAARVSFAAFVLSLLCGMLVPIYTDEVGWRLQERAGLDGGFDRMYNDICGLNTIAAPPWFMMPFRYVSGWLNSAFPDPLYVRLVGVFCAVTWALMFKALIERVTPDKQQRSVLIAIAFGLLGMGLLPWFLVLSRPEHPILLASMAAILIASHAATVTKTPVWLWPLAVVVLGAAATSYHMKGVLFLPLFLACIFFASTGRHKWALRGIAMLGLTILTGFAAAYWVNRFSCPGDAILASQLNEKNLASQLANGANWRDVAGSALAGTNLNRYIMMVEPRPFLISQWLPDNLTPPNVSVLRYIPAVISWNLAMLGGLFCLVAALIAGWREKQMGLRLVIPMVTTSLVLVWGMSQPNQHDYEATTILPLLAIAIVFSFGLLRWSQAWTDRLRLAAAVIVVISVVAQIDIAVRYGPALLHRAVNAGYVAGQPTSVSAYGYAPIAQQIRQTARQCGIGVTGRAQHPLVDDVTYFAMADSWQPFHRLGVLSKWNGQIRDPLAYLKSRGSEGLIVGCQFLDGKLRAKAIRNGDFCCISTR